jgi:tetratricopeptide (TPR) repeat protein
MYNDFSSSPNMDVAIMGNKAKKHGRQQSANDLFQYAQRAMEKQDFKEALKNAKVCFRQDPSHEHRQILERSWLARGLQLARAGLQTEGRAAAQELLAMGVSQPDVQQGLPELLLAVGLYDQAVASGKICSNGQEADPVVLARAADRAVVDPASAPVSLSGIREGATRVRAALDALDGGDEGAAMAALGDVPRNSPFAPWKLFVRGLAAYYRHDDEAMRANWDRLDADRFPARLAAVLRRLADPASAGGDQEEFRQAIRILEKDLCGGPVVWYLESLQQSLRDHRWREAVFALRRWKKEFQAALPGIAQRLDRLFYDMAVRKTNPKRLRDLTTAIDPPRWDPRWNRAWAMICEAEEEDIERAQVLWLAYLEDLASMPDLKPGERTLAQAMVWERLGRQWADEYDDYDDYDEEDEEDEEDEGAEYYQDEKFGRDRRRLARAKAVEYFNKAICLAPGFSAAYHALAGNYVHWEEEDAAAEVHRRLLAQVPDDISAITFLFRYHRKRDEVAARDYALQARRLKPASDEMLNMVVAGHFLAARTLTLQGRWDEARAELAAVAAAGPASGAAAYDLAVCRAMVEFKAGQPAAGRHWVDQALSGGDDPADVYMALSIESVRYELPFELGGMPVQFQDHWLSSMKKRRGRAAGAMSRRMWAFMREELELSGKYAFLNDYLERVIKYVSRCSRIRWQADDLLHVCRFFDQVAVDQQFREVRRPLVKFLDTGRKKFPQEPEFHVMRGEVEMRRGPTFCDRRLARKCFEMAIETAKTSLRPKAKEIQQAASQRLRLLGRDDGGGPRRRGPRAASDFDGFPPGSFSGRGPREEMMEIIKQMCALSGRSPREEMIEAIKRMCAAAGVDPQEAIDEFLGASPLGARTEGRK